METTTIIHRDPLPKVRRVALAFILAAALIAGSFAVVAGEDEKPASAAPVASECATGIRFPTIPPQGGAKGGPILRNTQGQSLPNGAGRIWVTIRGLDDAVWITYLTVAIDNQNNSAGNWSGVWYSLGGATISTPRLDSVNGYGLYVITLGTDGNTYRRWLGTNGWGGWTGTIGQAAYYGTPSATSTTVDGWPYGDFPFHVRRTPNNGTQPGVPEYRCDRPF